MRVGGPIRGWAASCVGVGLALAVRLFATPASAAQEPGAHAETTPTAVLSVARQTVRHVHAVLLLPPPPPAIEEELYDYYLLISERAATGEISPWWAAYLYTSYFRDLLRDRPSGNPRRTRDELRAHLQREVDYYYIRKRPDAEPAPFGAWIYEAVPAQ